MTNRCFLLGTLGIAHSPAASIRQQKSDPLEMKYYLLYVIYNSAFFWVIWGWHRHLEPRNVARTSCSGRREMGLGAQGELGWRRQLNPWKNFGSQELDLEESHSPGWICYFNLLVLLMWSGTSIYENSSSSKETSPLFRVTMSRIGTFLVS